MSLRDKLLATPVSAEPIMEIDGEKVFARKLSGLDVADAQASLPDTETRNLADLIRFSAKLVFLGSCDAEGNRVFEASDYDAICNMQHTYLMQLADRIRAHNNMGDDVKNSSTPSTDAS